MGVFPNINLINPVPQLNSTLGGFFTDGMQGRLAVEDHHSIEIGSRLDVFILQTLGQLMIREVSLPGNTAGAQKPCTLSHHRQCPLKAYANPFR